MSIIIRQPNNINTINQNSNSVIVKSSGDIYNTSITFMPFFIVATSSNQTVFVLPRVPVSVVLVAINGILQSGIKTPTPDYTISGSNLTLSSGVDIGDTIFGLIQV